MDYSQYKQLEFRRKFWKLFGAEIFVRVPGNESLVGFIKMKAWKLREDVRFYRDQTMQQEVFALHARQIIDFGATYDVFDSPSGQKIFSLRRKGLKSAFVRDHWDILDANDNLIGAIEETSGTLAIFRRWLDGIFDLIFMFVPQKYDINLYQNGSQYLAAHITHKKNPAIVKMLVDTSVSQIQADPRVALSAASILSIIDASKN